VYGKHVELKLIWRYWWRYWKS